MFIPPELSFEIMSYSIQPNFRLVCKEWKDEVIFLHKIVEGSSDDSYGIYVAKLAGIPTTEPAFGLPAVLKGFLDRVFVPGVAFTLDPRTEKVRPGLLHVRRLVGITTYGSARLKTRLFTDPGRRTLLRTVRLVCNRLARSRWLGFYGFDTSSPTQREAFLERVESEMARL